MTNTVAAENTAGRGEKEKVEKRRALGRGLESLLPGPRVVAGTAGPGAVASPPFAKNAKDGAPTVVVRPVGPVGEVLEGTIRTEVEETVGESTGAAELRSASPGLRPGPTLEGGQPGAAVPTFSSLAARDSSAVGTPDETITIYAQAESRMPGNLVVNVELEAIDKNPYQTRYEFDDEKLEELAESIRANGVVQPVLVRPAEEEGRYVLILGERRCRASKMAGRTTVPAMVKRVSEQQAAEMTIIENLQREDLNCMEQAEAFRVLSQEFHLTQQQIGERVGMSRVSVTNYMRLLKLTQPTMEHVIAGRISFSEARELLKLEDPITIEKAAEQVVKEQMKFEQVEALVMRMQGWLDPIPGTPGQEKKKSGARWVDPNVRAAQMELERTLGVRVRIRDRKGKGKIVIEYHTVDDYERVVEMLKGRKG